jgi:hypothetical protein
MAKRHSDTQYTFKVNLKGNKRLWRTVVLRGDHRLSDLHEIIFGAFDRYDQHLYSFYFPKQVVRRDRFDFPPKEYTSPIMLEEADPFSERKPSNAAKTKLDSLRLEVGQTFEYLFDFGDNWLHEIKVTAIEPVDKTKKTTLPLILERRGESPPQYPDYDEEDEQDDREEE